MSNESKTYTVTVSILSKVKVYIKATSPNVAKLIADEIPIERLEELAYEQGITDTLDCSADATPTSHPETFLGRTAGISTR